MSADPGQPAIDLRELHVTYAARRKQPARHAVRGVTLSIPPGQFVALLGPNGSGKSSLIRAVCGLVPFKGDIAVHGESDIGSIRRSLGVVLQSPSLDPNMTIRENLRDIAALHGVPPDTAAQRIDNVLRHAGLADRTDSLVKRLSGGLKRRADLARALVHEPSVLLLDEPTVGLDPPSRRAFLHTLLEQRTQSDITILLSTHLTDEADQADRVLFMHEGKLVADDPPDLLRRKLGERLITVASTDKPPVDDIAWSRTSHGWTAELSARDTDIARLSARLAAAECAFTIAPPSLDDAFESLTGMALREHDNA